MFCRKMHENEKKMDGAPHLDPPTGIPGLKLTINIGDIVRDVVHENEGSEDKITLCPPKMDASLNKSLTFGIYNDFFEKIPLIQLLCISTGRISNFVYILTIFASITQQNRCSPRQIMPHIFCEWHHKANVNRRTILLMKYHSPTFSLHLCIGVHCR